ncbi:hypothetical protein [Corynebacterium cystitidis]|uniref:hypothetical protein n=1 Tax=Corynebacterium cystitidis TaxID=35757 RepID=UPI00115FE560|nr:hypothetical protein [Corynebacterium cystitidis]
MFLQIFLGSGWRLDAAKIEWSTTGRLKLQEKAYTTDFLTKPMKVNEGEVPQYYVAGDYPAIVEPATWDVVQTELVQYSGKGTTNTHPFSKRARLAALSRFRLSREYQLHRWL